MIRIASHREPYRKVRSKLPIHTLQGGASEEVSSPGVSNTSTSKRFRRRNLLGANCRNAEARTGAQAAEGLSPGRILHGTPVDRQQILRPPVNFRTCKARQETETRQSSSAESNSELEIVLGTSGRRALSTKRERKRGRVAVTSDCRGHRGRRDPRRVHRRHVHHDHHHDHRRLRHRSHRAPHRHQNVRFADGLH